MTARRTRSGHRLTTCRPGQDFIYHKETSAGKIADFSAIGEVMTIIAPPLIHSLNAGCVSERDGGRGEDFRAATE